MSSLTVKVRVTVAYKSGARKCSSKPSTRCARRPHKRSSLPGCFRVLLGSDVCLNVWGWFRGTPFRSPLQGVLKGLGGGGRRSEGRRGLHLRKASTRLQGGFKGASRGLEGGLKEASPWKASKKVEGGGLRLEGGFKGA